MPLTYDISLNPKGGIRVRSYVAPKTKEYERYKMKQSKLFERIRRDYIADEKTSRFKVLR